MTWLWVKKTKQKKRSTSLYVSSLTYGLFSFWGSNLNPATHEACCVCSQTWSWCDDNMLMFPRRMEFPYFKARMQIILLQWSSLESALFFATRWPCRHRNTKSTPCTQIIITYFILISTLLYQLHFTTSTFCLVCCTVNFAWLTVKTDTDTWCFKNPIFQYIDQFFLFHTHETCCGVCSFKFINVVFFKFIDLFTLCPTLLESAACVSTVPSAGQTLQHQHSQHGCRVFLPSLFYFYW